MLLCYYFRISVTVYGLLLPFLFCLVFCFFLKTREKEEKLTWPIKVSDSDFLFLKLYLFFP